MNKDTDKQYHHGALRDAMIEATDALLAEGGLEGFSLRAAARRAGVSPTAPAHHFGSSAGLLTEVAIRAFEALTTRLNLALAGEYLPAARLRALGHAYVAFALSHPGRFHLMFRTELLVKDDERLVATSGTAMVTLEACVRAFLTDTEGPTNEDRVRSLMLGAWSAVHGFAHLALDGKFDRMAAQGGRSAFIERELPAMLTALWPDRPAVETGGSVP